MAKHKEKIRRLNEVITESMLFCEAIYSKEITARFNICFLHYATLQGAITVTTTQIEISEIKNWEYMAWQTKRTEI